MINSQILFTVTYYIKKCFVTVYYIQSSKCVLTGSEEAKTWGKHLPQLGRVVI